jgi:hypothetical protein
MRKLRRQLQNLALLIFAACSGAEASLPSSPSSIKFLVTAALLDESLEVKQMRQEQYKQSLITLKDYGYRPYIVEACLNGPPSLFEEFSPFVCYSNVNDLRLRNKGVNEARSMIEAFRHFEFSDEDILIKLTGRYCFTSRRFLNMIEEHPEIDACVCYNVDYPIRHARIATGCFALRAKYFKQFLAGLDFAAMEKWMTDIELELGNYIRKLSKIGAHIVIVDQLGLSANVGGTSYPPVYQQW